MLLQELLAPAKQEAVWGRLKDGPVDAYVVGVQQVVSFCSWEAGGTPQLGESSSTSTLFSLFSCKLCQGDKLHWQEPRPMDRKAAIHICLRRSRSMFLHCHLVSGSGVVCDDVEHHFWCCARFIQSWLCDQSWELPYIVRCPMKMILRTSSHVTRGHLFSRANLPSSVE